MNKWKTIADIRREYGNLNLDEKNLPTSPYELFEKWFTDVIKTEKNDPTAVVLSTVDNEGKPDSRVVLIKEIKVDFFVFFTNYDSVKGEQINANPNVALNFYWPEMSRQVRIRGIAERISAAESDSYFYTRPLLSQFSAIISPQSKVLDGRDVLEQSLAKYIQTHDVPKRPDNWGGYAVVPIEYEFWQGRNNRLHDRIKYIYYSDCWKSQRLAP